MATGSAEATNLFEDLLTAVERLGVKATSKILRLNIDQHDLRNNEDATLVLSVVGKTFKIPAYEIVHGIGRKNDRKLAIGFCAYYLHIIFKYDMNDVCTMLNKSKWVCYKYSKLITSINANNRVDKIYANRKKRFDLKIEKNKIDAIVQNHLRQREKSVNLS